MGLDQGLYKRCLLGYTDLDKRPLREYTQSGRTVYNQREPLEGFPLARSCLSTTCGVAFILSEITADLSSPKPRLAVFIDGLNVMFRLREAGWEEFFDVGYLAQRLKRGRELVGVFFFRAAPQSPPLDRAQYWSEVRHLNRVGNQLWKSHARLVRYGYMILRDGRWQEKQIDVWLASEMITQACANLYDIAILVTADTDLVPAVDHVRVAHNKGVELLVFPRSNTNVTQLVRAANSTTTARRSWFRPY